MPRKSQYDKEKIIDQMRRYRSDDPQVRNDALMEIFNENTALINHIINKHFPTYKQNYHDIMYSAGKVGLLTALEKYDPEKSRLSTFLSLYILHEIYECICSEIFHTKPHHAHEMFQVLKAIQDFEQLNGREPDTRESDRKDLVVRTGMSFRAVDKALTIKEFGNMQHYNTEAILDLMMTEYNASPEDLIMEQYDEESLQHALSKLTTVEKEIVFRKYGINGRPKQKHSDIADVLDISIDTINKYKNSAFTKIKSNLKASNCYYDYNKNFAKEVGEQDIALAKVDIATNQLHVLVEDDATDLPGV